MGKFYESSYITKAVNWKAERKHRHTKEGKEKVLQQSKNTATSTHPQMRGQLETEVWAHLFLSRAYSWLQLLSQSSLSLLFLHRTSLSMFSSTQRTSYQRFSQASPEAYSVMTAKETISLTSKRSVVHTRGHNNSLSLRKVFCIEIVNSFESENK